MKKRKINSDYTISLCKEVMNGVDLDDLQQIKNCLLKLCDLIEEFKDDKFSNSLSQIFEIIVFHITNDPARADLILESLLNFDIMITNVQESTERTKDVMELFFDNIKTKKSLDFLDLKTILEKISKKSCNGEGEENKDTELNLFNPDGTRCSVDEILNS